MLSRVQSYRGQMNEQGQAHGWGTAVLADGRTIEGEFRDGLYLETADLQVVRTPTDGVKIGRTPRLASPTTAAPIDRHRSRLWTASDDAPPSEHHEKTRINHSKESPRTQVVTERKECANRRERS